MTKKDKHIIYYDNRYGRNDGPPLYYKYAMEMVLKLNIKHSLPIGDTLRENGPVDYHWWIDWGEDGLMPHYKEWYPPQDGGKTIYVSSDTHLGRDYRFQKALQFDYVFFNQLRAVEEFKKLYPKKKNVYWLPHAAEPKVYKKTHQLKKYDICFIGHIQDVKNYNGFTRVDMLDRAFKEFPNFYWGTRNGQKPELNMFEDAAKRFNQSKIVLNVSIGDDLNMRLFETLSTGSFLLTNYLPTLDKLFKDGKHLVTYKTLDEMVEKIKYYLEHDKEREKIAKTGYEEFIKKHKYSDRIQTVLRIIEKGGEK